jgi:hypothetical protein
MNETVTKFTLRFHNRRTHDLLGLVADQFGVSKNQLAEQMLERELEAAALLVERDLDDALQLLKGYRGDERLGQDIQAFAEAEVNETDPLRSRMAEPAELRDVFGVAEAFSR